MEQWEIRKADRMRGMGKMLSQGGSRQEYEMQGWVLLWWDSGRKLEKALWESQKGGLRTVRKS